MMNLQLFGLDDDKLDNFSFNYADQVDEWGKSVGDYQVIQQSMDSRAEELRVKYNSLIDQLVSLLGATEVGATKLSDGVSLSDIQTELEYLQTELQNVVLDQIPDNTLTYQKLAQLVRQDIQSMYKIYDAGGTATNVTVTTDEGNFTYSNGKWVQFEVKIAGTISDVNIDGQGAIGLEDKEGELLDVEVGDIILAKYDDGGGTPFFLGASRGGSLDRSFLQQYDLTNEVLLNEKGKEISVKVGEYVNCEFYETFINDGGTGQVIPPITQATSSTDLLATVDGTLEMNELTEGYVYEGHITKTQQWLPSMEGASAGPIKSIQRGETSILGTQTTINITIAEVDLTKAIVRVSRSFSTTFGYAADDTVDIELTSATNIRISRDRADDLLLITWEVIEFQSVKSLQIGTSSRNSTTPETSVAISLVDLSKSILFFSFKSNAISSYQGVYSMKGRFINNTTLGFLLSASTTTPTNIIKWQVIEFN